LTLTADERAQAQLVVTRGHHAARIQTRARVLLKLADGWSATEISQALAVSPATIWRVRRRFATGGLAATLSDRRQARRRAALTGEQQAHLIAVACSDAPDGHDHWTLRLLAAKVVELGFVARISPETVRALLKKTPSNPGSTKRGAFPP
jgi:transposase